MNKSLIQIGLIFISGIVMIASGWNFIWALRYYTIFFFVLLIISMYRYYKDVKEVEDE